PTPSSLPGELSIRWSPVYQPQWDDTPQSYVDAGLVGVGRSRRLAKAEDRSRAFKAYLGVQHWDPSRWNLPGDARSVFFLSLFHNRHTLALRTYPTLSAALSALTDAWHTLA
ncbi:MAG TPA: hypothetical protein VFU63_14800, partial [Ktedonobacterales bacterium]|nr:hypothetical protein [Ktedonobacterales bacterium]